MEAEKLRHGTKAVAMVGLMNESTGNTVDMDAPVERYLVFIVWRSSTEQQIRVQAGRHELGCKLC